MPFSSFLAFSVYCLFYHVSQRCCYEDVHDDFLGSALSPSALDNLGMGFFGWPVCRWLMNWILSVCSINNNDSLHHAMLRCSTLIYISSQYHVTTFPKRQQQQSHETSQYHNSDLRVHGCWLILSRKINFKIPFEVQTLAICVYLPCSLGEAPR